MRIKNIKLVHFRQFIDLSIELPNTNFIVLLGENGVGKTSLIDAISLNLAHIVGKLCSPIDSYEIQSNLLISDINNQNSSIEIILSMEAFNRSSEISISKEIDQKGSSYNFNPADTLKDVRRKIKKNEKCHLPLMVYYRVNRTYQIKNQEVVKPYFNKILEGYRNSFTPKISAFSNFEHWFIRQENIENQAKIVSRNLDFESPVLKMVRSGIISFLNKIDTDNNYTNLRVERNSETNLVYHSKFKDGNVVLNKNDKTISIEQLSSGEKMIIYLVADIARRLIILNYESEESLLNQGVVLIDELEMHLHPSWQRNIVSALQYVFPNLLFICSSHSPQVISNLKSECILELEENQQIIKSNYQTLGVDANSLLETVFDTSDRSNEIKVLIDDFHVAIEKGENLVEVESKLQAIRDYKSYDNGMLSDSLLDELAILLSAYKFEMEND